MNYLQTFANNSSVSLGAGVFGAIGSYSFFEYGYYQVPLLDYDVPIYLVYGGMVGLSSFLLRNTGDFVLPLISNNTQLNSLSKITVPLSIGLISVATLFVVNGFDIPSSNSALKMILLSGGSYVAADWTMDKFYNMGSNSNNNNMLIPNNNPVPFVPNIPNNNISIMPFPGNKLIPPMWLF